MSMSTRKHFGEYGMGVSILRATLCSAEVRKHLGVLFLFILILFSPFRSRPSRALLGALLGPSWGPFEPSWACLGPWLRGPYPRLSSLTRPGGMREAIESGGGL